LGTHSPIIRNTSMMTEFMSVRFYSSIQRPSASSRSSVRLTL
jgi:hypothetical protein